MMMTQKYVTHAQILLSWWTLSSIFNNYLYNRNDVALKFNGQLLVPCIVSSNWHTRLKDRWVGGRILLFWMSACHSRWLQDIICVSYNGLFVCVGLMTEVRVWYYGAGSSVWLGCCVDDWVKNGDCSPLKKYCYAVIFGDCCIVSSGTVCSFNCWLFLCPIYLQNYFWREIPCNF